MESRRLLLQMDDQTVQCFQSPQGSESLVSNSLLASRLSRVGVQALNVAIGEDSSGVRLCFRG